MVPDQEGEVLHLGYGFSVLWALGAVFAEPLPLGPRRAPHCRAAALLHRAYCLLINVALWVFLVTTLHGVLVRHVRVAASFMSVVYVVPGLLSIAEGTLRSIFLLANRGGIGLVMRSVRGVVSSEVVPRLQQRALLRRLSLLTVAVLAVFLLLYLGALAGNFLCLSPHFEEHFRGSGGLNRSSAPLEVLEFWIYIEGIQSVVPSLAVLPTCVALVYWLFLLGVGKLLVSDTLFFAWYWLLTEQLGLLARRLGRACQQREDRRFGDVDPLEAWLTSHQKIIRTLHAVNSITAPCIAVAVVSSACQLCLCAYVMAQHHMELRDMISYLIYSGVVLSHLFIYCLLGHRLREKALEVHRAAYEAPWLGADRRVACAAVLVGCSASERTSPLPGAPLFSLSLEFLASILGAVFTYFILLLQLYNTNSSN